MEQQIERDTVSIDDHNGFVAEVKDVLVDISDGFKALNNCISMLSEAVINLSERIKELEARG